MSRKDFAGDDGGDGTVGPAVRQPHNEEHRDLDDCGRGVVVVREGSGEGGADQQGKSLDTKAIN